MLGAGHDNGQAQDNRQPMITGRPRITGRLKITGRPRMTGAGPDGRGSKAPPREGYFASFLARAAVASNMIGVPIMMDA